MYWYLALQSEDADDLALLSHFVHDMQNKTQRLNEVAYHDFVVRMLYENYYQLLLPVLIWVIYSFIQFLNRNLLFRCVWHVS